jgi:CheY-like chemotaxis protein/Spy/CpxP family protein refolding chaperone
MVKSLWKEILAGALLVALVLGLFAAPSALASLVGRHRHGGHDPERMKKHAEFATEFVLREVDATPDQTERVKAIVGGAIDELLAGREPHDARRDALLAELAQPEISRTALQSLRAEELALWDDLDEARRRLRRRGAVLTPEQRVRLIELAREHHAGHGDGERRPGRVTEARGEAHGRTHTVIDDDTSLSSMVAQYLGARGLDVVTRPDAASGLAELARSRFDALVLDLMLPDQDGFEVCRRVRAGADLPILMLTARGDEADRIVGPRARRGRYLQAVQPARAVGAPARVLRRSRATRRSGLRCASAGSRSIATLASCAWPARRSRSPATSSSCSSRWPRTPVACSRATRS